MHLLFSSLIFHTNLFTPCHTLLYIKFKFFNFIYFSYLNIILDLLYSGYILKIQWMNCTKLSVLSIQVVRFLLMCNVCLHSASSPSLFYTRLMMGLYRQYVTKVMFKLVLGYVSFSSSSLVSVLILSSFNINPLPSKASHLCI